MDNGEQKPSEGAIPLLIVLAWIASIVSVPFYINAITGMGMSPGASHGTRGELLKLVAWPMVALVASILVLLRRNITASQAVLAILPLVLSFCELIFAFIVWVSG